MATWADRRDAYNAEMRGVARQEEARRRLEEERNALAEILRSSYEPGMAATPDRPYQDADVGSGVGPMAMGSPIPGTAQPERPVGINMPNAIARMAQSRFAPEALKLQQEMSSQDSGIRKVLLEHELKQRAQKEMFENMRGMGGGSGLQPGYTMEVGPQGPKMAYDPAKAANLSIDQARLFHDTGRGPGVSTGTGARSPMLTPKGEAEASAKRLKDLEESATSRQGALERAKKFLDLIQAGKMKTGAGRRAAGYVPGVYTEQGQYDEEFNAFAETAARQALKAAGEQRPTDADVKGMKEAMFGVGRDEKTNLNLLHSYMTQQTQDENAYRALKGQPLLPLPTPPKLETKNHKVPTGAKRFKDNQTGKEVFSTDGKTYFDVETGKRVQ